MYQNCCKKCGSISLYTKNNGNNVGLYCSDCGAWIKWLSKDELRAFEHSKDEHQTMNDGAYDVKPIGTKEQKVKEYDKILEAYDDIKRQLSDGWFVHTCINNGHVKNFIVVYEREIERLIG